MKAWWIQLNAREQTLVSSLGAVLVIFILYSVVWKPLNDNIAQAEKKLTNRESLLDFVSAETQRYKAVNLASPTKSLAGSLSSIINQTARAQQITITRLQPQSKDVQVWIDSVSFDKLLTWLSDISNNEGIHVQTIDFAQAEQSGQVRVKRLQLGKG